MPRRADPRNETHRQKTERWRSRLREQRQPEACHVDVAAAAALSAMLVRIQDSGEPIPAALQDLISNILSILRSRGFEGRGAARKLMARLLLRKDRFELVRAVSSDPKRITSKPDDAAVSPHYFVTENRIPREARSDNREDDS